MNEDEMKLVKIMLAEYFNMRSVVDPHEALGLDPNHKDNPTADWLDDTATELTKTIEEASA